MFKYLLKILLVLSLGVLVSCAKRNPEPIASEDFLKSAEEDLVKIQKIKEENKNSHCLPLSFHSLKK